MVSEARAVLENRFDRLVPTVIIRAVCDLLDKLMKTPV